MENENSAYRVERDLVDDLYCAMEASRTPWGAVKLAREFSYGRGRTDLIAVDAAGRVIAFEAKIADWREALHQAYRNTCFAHSSYVVLPWSSAKKAARHYHEFQRRAVGLCYLVNGCIEVVLAAEDRFPLQPWLAEAAAKQAGDD